ncbi:MAG: alpha/beta hydrolase [Pseudomonadota bacterium]
MDNIAELGHGATAYELAGDGPLIVLVHGLTTPSFVWDALLPLLHAGGYSTLRYDLYGRGGSDAGHAVYDAALYTRQLFDLLDHLEITNPVPICGYSMGGGIVACATASHPSRVSSLILLAPTGFKTALDDAWRMLRTPVLGPAYMSLFGGTQIRRSALAEARELGLKSNIGELQAAATRKPGFLRAVRKSLIEGPMAGLEGVHAKISNTHIPVLAIWGRQDLVISIDGKDVLARLNPQAQQIVIDDAQHALAYTHEARVSQEVLSFLGRGVSG